MLLREPSAAALAAGLRAPLAEFVAQRFGLAFEGDRVALLARGVAAAAAESGDGDASAFALRLLEGTLPETALALVAARLTIGETYFFREPATLDLLRQEILPELLAERRSTGSDERRLRLWSAGCATGEEAYSVAMLLDRMIADGTGWDVGLLATDLNPQFLAQARRGIYRDWSFRALPEEMKRCFFRPAAEGGLEIAARLRRHLRFAPLNLADPTFPAEENGTAGLDVILCRNVLLYFAPAPAQQAAARLAACLRPGGWLLIGAAEAGLACFTENDALEPLLPTVYRKRTVRAARPRSTAAAPRKRAPPAPAASPPGKAAAAVAAGELCRRAKEALCAGRHEEASRLASQWRDAAPLDIAPGLLLARIQADRGALGEALELLDRALAREGAAPEIHYLRGSILVEMGRRADASRCFNRALYLVPDFVPAHYGLGLLALRDGKESRARRHFDNALAILAARPAEQEVAELEGLRVGDLADMINAMRRPGMVEKTP